MNTQAISSPRLGGKPPSPSDSESYAKLFAQPEVAATLWPPPLGGARTPLEAAEILEADLDRWRRDGFGPWLFHDRGSSRFVGRGGITRSSVGGHPGVEVFYAVAREFWGQGYATEMGAGAVQMARALQLPEIVGFTLTTNLASQRVLQKLGLRFERYLEHAGLPHWFGRLDLSASVHHGHLIEEA